MDKDKLKNAALIILVGTTFVLAFKPSEESTNIIYIGDEEHEDTIIDVLEEPEDNSVIVEEEREDSNNIIDNTIDSINGFYEEYKPSDEQIDYILSELKDDVVSAPEDFKNSINELYGYIDGYFNNDDEVIYDNLDENTDAYNICFYICEYSSFDSYEEDTINSSINLLNNIVFSDLVEDFSDDEKYYIYLASLDLVSSLLERGCVDEYSNFAADFSNTEYLLILNSVLNEKIELYSIYPVSVKIRSK